MAKFSISYFKCLCCTFCILIEHYFISCCVLATELLAKCERIRNYEGWPKNKFASCIFQIVYFWFISSYNKNTHFNFYDWQFTFHCSPHHEWGICHIVKLAFQFTVDRRARYRREDPDPLYCTWLIREEVELELHPISGPCLGTRARFLSFNRIQSRAIIGLLTGHNTLRRHLHLLGLLDSPLCRRCAAEEETSAHILCDCEALASLIHAYLGSFSLEPEDIKSISLGATWKFSKVTGLP